jgi:hypothetical protein
VILLDLTVYMLLLMHDNSARHEAQKLSVQWFSAITLLIGAIGNFAIIICGLRQYAIGPTNHRHRRSHQS